jgi:GR25 family glycosyltransferase involved in LPS biosynthesis
MQKTFKEQNLEVHRWTAIDAKKYGFSNPTGAFFSHMTLLCFCNIANIEYALIFEDDVVLCKNFVQKLQEILQEIPSDWDALSLHCFKAETSKISGNLCKLLSPTFGNHAVLFNSRGINKVLNNKNKLCIEEKYFKSLDNFYAVNLDRTMAFQTGEDSDIPETSIINEYKNFYEKYKHLHS